MSSYTRSPHTTLTQRSDYDDDYDDDNSLDDAEEVEEALSNVDNEFDDTEDALSQWSRSAPSHSAMSPSSYAQSQLPRYNILSTISERSEIVSSRPTSGGFQATRPSNPTPDAFRRSAQLVGSPSGHSRSSTDPGFAQAQAEMASPARPGSRRAGDLIAFFEDKSAAPVADAPPPMGHSRAASAPGFPRSSSPYLGGGGAAAARSRPSSPTKSRSSVSSSNSASASMSSLLSPPALKALTAASTDSRGDGGRAWTYTSGYGSGTDTRGGYTSDTRGYTTDSRTFAGTDTRTFTPTDSRTYTDTRGYDTRTDTRTYDTDARSYTTDTRSFTPDTHGYTTDTRTHTRAYTSPDSRSYTYNTEGPTTAGGYTTLTSTFTGTSPTQTPTQSSLRRTAPLTSARSPITSVRNIVAAWKERTPSTKSAGAEQVASGGDVVGRVLSIRRNGGAARRSGAERDRASETGTTRSTALSDPGFDVDELKEYAKNNREVSV
jgi:hypothetical protein